ncbi:MAG: DUF192 domain-containing protein [Gammaproteobacteria bacterium]|nr:DUF192 domain-containing protein [Gammaproteobacteria bacterium]
MIETSSQFGHGKTFTRIISRIFFLVTGVFFLVGCPADADGISGFSQTTIRIETRAGRSLEVEVFLALSREQQTRGLMFVKELGDRQGMLFVYQQSHNISMWMKNTVLPLDMLFIRPDGSIARIEKETVPFSLDSISSGEPVVAVLELNGGVTGKYGIQPGDKVISRYFGND